jgi:tRNA modification GTPase
VPLHVIDTAGLRDSDDVVEKIGIERAWEQIRGADAVLFLHDLTRSGEAGHRAADEQLLATLRAHLPASVPVLQLWNKADAAPAAGVPAGDLRLSAKRGEGLQELRQRLLEVAGWQAAPEGVYIARERHLHALRRVDGHLMEAAAHLAGGGQALDLLAEELRLAQNALSEITGEFTADDLLGVIFSKFCIGK